MRDKNKTVKPTAPFGRCPKVLANRFVANAQGFQVLLWSCGSFIRDTAPCILWYSLNSTRHLISFFYLQKKTEANRNEFNSLWSFPTSSNSPAFRSQIVSITMAVAGAVPAGSFLSTLLQVHIWLRGDNCRSSSEALSLLQVQITSPPSTRFKPRQNDAPVEGRRVKAIPVSTQVNQTL